MGVGSTTVSQWLVLLETSANQRYVFGSNRRRENAGASEVLASVVADGLGKTVAAGVAFETLQLISGKAILRTDSEADGQAIVRAATRHALAVAPGVELRGVVVPVGTSLKAAITRAHQQIEQVRHGVPGPETRYPRLPVVAP